MATMRMFSDYNEAKAFYGTLTKAQEPTFKYDVEFGQYMVEYYK